MILDATTAEGASTLAVACYKETILLENIPEEEELVVLVAGYTNGKMTEL